MTKPPALRLVSTTRFAIDDCVIDGMRKDGIPLTVDNYIINTGMDWPLKGEHAAYVEQLVRLGILMEDTHTLSQR